MHVDLRKIRNSEVWQDPDLLRLWLLCLMKADHKPYQQWIGNQVVDLQPGQFVIGRDTLAEEYNSALPPRKKVKPLTLWRWLQKLQKIGNLNIKTTNKFSVVTVVNWSEYQQVEQQMNSKGTSNEQQMNSTLNNKSDGETGVIPAIGGAEPQQVEQQTNGKVNTYISIINNNNNNSLLEPQPLPSSYADLVDEIEEYYQTKRLQPGWPAREIDREFIRQAIKEGFTRDEMIQGINIAFLQADEVNSFEYCLKVMRTERKRREKAKNKKVIPMTRSYNNVNTQEPVRVNMPTPEDLERQRQVEEEMWRIREEKRRKREQQTGGMVNGA